MMVVAGLAICASACATTTDASSPFVMGSVASAPTGLIDLCHTGGLDCPDADEPTGDLVEPATGGGVKSNEPREPLVEPAPEPERTAEQPEPERVAFERFDEIEQVNRAINQRLIWRSDLDQYGVEEFWTFPLQAGLRYGDCEDFALEKRRELLERGFPPSALALATAYSEETGLHAVLVVRTNQGDYVLDNTTPWVLPWSQSPYRWLTIQQGESLTAWRLIEA
ncbi:transglutaminase-like cysteine peptidase [Maricaulis parjimensis]|uniref:transglutaminase-like cysteine peptidase n=1 Tax=Maricaulis parjimensis TaxID=144023 RepID=UPI001939D438|nr:transglutaminase-like cysteine peptidase [Maricaulis parjimensis]